MNIENLKQLRQVNDERRFVFSATNLARATKDSENVNLFLQVRDRELGVHGPLVLFCVTS